MLPTPGAELRHVPVNGNEAEARRARAVRGPWSQAPGALYPPQPERPHREFPLTLDLRRAIGV